MKGMLLLAAFAALACTDGPSDVRPRAPAAARVSTIGGMPGPEDFVVDTNEGRSRLLVSSRDRRKAVNAEGEIFQVDLRAEPPCVTAMEINWGKGPRQVFRPQGIALMNDLLFVANQGDRSTAASVDVFHVAAKKLSFRERIRSRHIVYPDDLDVRPLKNGDYELFVTNPVPFDKKGAMFWETVVGPRTSFVARMKSGEGRSTRIGGLRYANGIVAHPDGSVYVSSTFDERVFRYRSGSAERNQIDIDALVDNLNAHDKTILVTASASGWKFIRHAMGAERGRAILSPTVVWRIGPGDDPATTLLFEDDGARISGGSSAVCVDSDLFIGQVFGDFILRVHGVCAERAS